MLVVAIDFPLYLCAEIMNKHRMHKILLLYNEPSLLVKSSLKLILQSSEILNDSHHVLLQQSIPRLLLLYFPLKKRYFDSLLALIFVLLLDDLESLVVA